MTFSGSTAEAGVAPRAPDIGERRGNLLVGQRRARAAASGRSALPCRRPESESRGRVGGGHIRRVHEIRAQLVLAAPIFLVAAQADVLVDLGAGIEALLLLRGQRRRRHDGRRPSGPIQLRRHVLREERDRDPCPPPASSARRARPGNETPRPGVTATRPPGALSPGRPPPPPPRPPRPPPPRPRQAPAARRRGPATAPVRCHSGCDASAMTSITRCTAATSPLFATAAASIATASVGDADAAVFACITRRQHVCFACPSSC